MGKKISFIDCLLWVSCGSAIFFSLLLLPSCRKIELDLQNSTSTLGMTTTIYKTNTSDSVLIAFNRNTRSTFRDTISWGDGSFNTVRFDSGAIGVSYYHKYASPGQYQIRFYSNKLDSITAFTVSKPDSIVSISNLSSLNRLYYLVLSNTKLPAIDFTGCSTLRYLGLENNSLTSNSLDNILVTLDGIGGLPNNGIIPYLKMKDQTPLTIPSTLGINAKNNLIAKGWKVETN